MLFLDDREPPELRRYMSAYDVQVEVTRLEYGDAYWEGRGQRGPVSVGVERKYITDFISSMRDRRLTGHQLRGMSEAYDYHYLIIEGLWRPHPSGCIEVMNGGVGWKPVYTKNYSVGYREVDGYISGLELRRNVIVCRTWTMQETAALLVSRYLNWQKEWEQHKSHENLYAPPPTVTRSRGRARLYTSTPSPAALVAAQLPGIDSKAWDVASHFKTVDRLVNASEREWQEIKGVGKTTARQVWQWLRK